MGQAAKPKTYAALWDALERQHGGTDREGAGGETRRKADLEYSLNWIRVADHSALYFGRHYWQRVCSLDVARGVSGGPQGFVIDTVTEIMKRLKRQPRSGVEMGPIRFEWQHGRAPSRLTEGNGATLIFAPPTMAKSRCLLAASWPRD